MRTERLRQQARGVNTFLTVVTIALVVVLLAVAVWTFVVAPFWVPKHPGRS